MPIYGQPHDIEMFNAAKAGEWEKVTAGLAAIKNINITEYKSSDEGKTIIWFAACAQQWVLVESICTKSSLVDVNAKQVNPIAGCYPIDYIDFYFDELGRLKEDPDYVDLDHNVLWFVFYYQQFILAKLLLAKQATVSWSLDLPEETQIQCKALESAYSGKQEFHTKINSNYTLGGVFGFFSAKSLPLDTCGIIRSFLTDKEAVKVLANKAAIATALSTYQADLVGVEKVVLDAVEEQRVQHLTPPQRRPFF